jgi:hypothetical protein
MEYELRLKLEYFYSLNLKLTKDETRRYNCYFAV